MTTTVDTDTTVEVLTIEEAAAILRISRNAAYAAARKWRATGGKVGIPCIEIGRTVRVPRADLDKLLGRTGGPTPPERSMWVEVGEDQERSNSLVASTVMSAPAPSSPSGSVLVVTGPPGSGKSTVAPVVADRLAGLAAYLEADWFWTTLRSSFIEPWRPESEHQNQTILRAVTSAAAALAIGGYDVVIDGVLGPWHLDIASPLLHTQGIELDYVVLRPDLATCLARAEARSTEPPRVPGHPPLADVGPITHMWEQFSDLGAYEAHVVDTTAMDAAATVEHLIRLRASRILRTERKP